MLGSLPSRLRILAIGGVLIYDAQPPKRVRDGFEIVLHVITAHRLGKRRGTIVTAVTVTRSVCNPSPAPRTDVGQPSTPGQRALCDLEYSRLTPMSPRPKATTLRAPSIGTPHQAIGARPGAANEAAAGRHDSGRPGCSGGRRSAGLASMLTG